MISAETLPRERDEKGKGKGGWVGGRKGAVQGERGRRGRQGAEGGRKGVHLPREGAPGLHPRVLGGDLDLAAILGRDSRRGGRTRGRGGRRRKVRRRAGRAEGGNIRPIRDSRPLAIGGEQRARGRKWVELARDESAADGGGIKGHGAGSWPCHGSHALRGGRGRKRRRAGRRKTPRAPPHSESVFGWAAVGGRAKEEGHELGSSRAKPGPPPFPSFRRRAGVLEGSRGPAPGRRSTPAFPQEEFPLARLGGKR